MTDDLTAIRELIERRAQGVRDKDADAALASTEIGARSFDLPPPLAYRHEPDPAREGISRWFETWDGPIAYETRDFEIDVDGRLALAHGFVRIGGRKVGADAASSSWFRQTLGLRRTAAGWRVVHEHISAPFRMDGSEKVALDLTP